MNDVSQIHSHWDPFFRYNPASRHRRRILKKLISRLSFRSVLDVGCGNGQLMSDLFGSRTDRNLLSLTAVDLNHSETPALLASIGATFHQLNLEKDPLPQKYDLIIASEVVEHTGDDAASARNLARMASRWVLVTVPTPPVFPSDRAMGHQRHYTKESLRALMEGAGFQTRACFMWGFPFHWFYRQALNINTEWTVKQFGGSSYGLLQILVCQLLYGLFFLNVPGVGTQLFYLGEIPSSR